MRALYVHTGRAVSRGDIVRDNHNEPFVFLYPTRPTLPHKSGKVVVSKSTDPTDTREYYAKVFGLEVHPDAY